VCVLIGLSQLTTASADNEQARTIGSRFRFIGRALCA
jgi:hypothetical protein